ncbi:unnamed protein product [Linum trigynum]|uniref:Uncharacterized protein n=1 Tax=Linum trigynum TaxID=586398 RepID=A0AAV2CC77_9ROSI
MLYNNLTLSKVSRSRSTMLGGVRQETPALLYMMSRRLCWDTAKSTASDTSDSLATSQGMNDALGPSWRAVWRPRSLLMSAIMTLAPLWMNLAAVSLPIPFAPPVITAILPSSFLPVIQIIV